MKKILLAIMLFFSSLVFSQLEDEIYNEEWYASLDEKINFIVFPNPTEERTIQFRIYRGFADQYKVRVNDATGKMVYEETLCRSDALDLNHLNRGVYHVTATDEEGNQIFKKLILN
jgi:hypothetical protein